MSVSRHMLRPTHASVLWSSSCSGERDGRTVQQSWRCSVPVLDASAAAMAWFAIHYTLKHFSHQSQYYIHLSLQKRKPINKKARMLKCEVFIVLHLEQRDKRKKKKRERANWSRDESAVENWKRKTSLRKLRLPACITIDGKEYSLSSWNANEFLTTMMKAEIMALMDGARGGGVVWTSGRRKTREVHQHFPKH